MEGNWVKGKLKGFGKKTLPLGLVYEGEFDEDNIEKGKCYFPNGDIYEGEFENSVPSGQGEKTWPDGRKYQGKWF